MICRILWDTEKDTVRSMEVFTPGMEKRPEPAAEVAERETAAAFGHAAPVVVLLKSGQMPLGVLASLIGWAGRDDCWPGLGWPLREAAADTIAVSVLSEAVQVGVLGFGPDGEVLDGREEVVQAVSASMARAAVRAMARKDAYLAVPSMPEPPGAGD